MLLQPKGKSRPLFGIFSPRYPIFCVGHSLFALCWPTASLGDIYFHGSDSVELDYPKALQHYREAARKGHADAMICEGVMHFRGLGTEQDDTKAFYAYQAAALQGNPHACRNLVPPVMSAKPRNGIT
jgi:hypothetical protein